MPYQSSLEGRNFVKMKEIQLFYLVAPKAQVKDEKLREGSVLSLFRTDNYAVINCHHSCQHKKSRVCNHSSNFEVALQGDNVSVKH